MKNLYLKMTFLYPKKITLSTVSNIKVRYNEKPLFENDIFISKRKIFQYFHFR